MARPVAGTRSQTLILTLPGSPKGAKENLQAVIKLLPHACQQAAGQSSREAHSGGVSKLEKDAGVSSSKSQSQDDHGHSHGHDHGHGGHVVPKSHTSNDPSLGPTHRARESPYPLLSVPDALALIDSQTPEPMIVRRPVDLSILTHVLAADVQAVEAVPAFRASIVDGYARRHDLGAEKYSKGTFPVAFAAHAEAGRERSVRFGEVARITTGAPVPSGADAVVMVEDTRIAGTRPTADGKEEEQYVEILTDEVKVGENIREIGSDVQAGTTVMRKGEGISATGGEFGLLASVGVQEVEVYKKPIVGVLSTGDEIIPHDHVGALQPGEVRDTNRPTLLAAVKAQGYEAIDLGIVKDKPGELESKLRGALARVDVLVTSGGVSMGELDLLKPTVERGLGGTIHFGRVAMKPGKPTTFATVDSSSIKDPGSGERGGSEGYEKKVIFSLPGNPASAVVTFMLFVLPALHKMNGVQPVGLPRVKVKVAEELRCDKQREEYQRVVVSVGRGAGANGSGEAELWARSTGGQRSSRIGSFKGANALVKLAPGGGTVKVGDPVEALLLDSLASG